MSRCVDFAKHILASSRSNQAVGPRLHETYVVISHNDDPSLSPAATQEDRIVVVPDLNVHVPAGRRSALDAPTKRSFFAVFDGREYSTSFAS